MATFDTTLAQPLQAPTFAGLRAAIAKFFETPAKTFKADAPAKPSVQPIVIARTDVVDLF